VAGQASSWEAAAPQGGARPPTERVGKPPKRRARQGEWAGHAARREHCAGQRCARHAALGTLRWARCAHAKRSMRTDTTRPPMVALFIVLTAMSADSLSGKRTIPKPLQAAGRQATERKAEVRVSEGGHLCVGGDGGGSCLLADMRGERQAHLGPQAASTGIGARLCRHRLHRASSRRRQAGRQRTASGRGCRTPRLRAQSLRSR
jgi:hypothetical protein